MMEYKFRQIQIYLFQINKNFQLPNQIIIQRKLVQIINNNFYIYTTYIWQTVYI